MTTVLLVFFIANFIIQNEASRILAVIPTPSISHQMPFRPLILELVNRGHEVVMLTTDPIFEKGQQPVNLTEIDLHDLSYQIFIEDFLNTTLTNGKKEDTLDQLDAIYIIMQKVAMKQAVADEVQNIIKDKSRTFDLLIMEALHTPALYWTHIFKDIPVIQMSSFGAISENLRTVGAPFHPLIHPTFLQQRIYKLTFWEKIKELYNSFHIESKAARSVDITNGNLKALFGEDFPEVSELSKNVDLLFLNMHPIWDMNRPVPPNVIYMGGLHQNPQKALPQDLKEYLDSSKNGVIYISFGTNVEPTKLPQEKIKILIDTFSKLPYDVLWKWNQDELPGRPKNVKISKWLPQSDLLRHPKVKLFITQAGLQSTHEAITAGVPVIGIPMLVDQWYNADQYVLHKVGLHVDMDTMTEEKIWNAIQTILGDKRYRENMVKLRTIMNDQPETPLQRAVWWTEYLLRHGSAKHLRSPAANTSWAEYLELELVSYLLLTLISVIVVLSLALRVLYNIFRKHRVNIKLKDS